MMQGNGLSMDVGNPKKMRICLAYKAEANQNLDLWPWLSRSEYLEGEFGCQGKCVARTVGFTIFPYILALVQKITYVECTKYVC